MTIPSGIDAGTVQGVDNRGKSASFDVTGLPTPTPTATPGVAVCNATPVSGCKAPAVSGKAQLQLRDRSPDEKDRLLWKWLKGTATTKSDFGSPLTTTGYALCLYDGTSTLLATASIPAAGTCHAASPRHCWRQSSSGFRYVDRDRTPDGVQQLVLTSGTTGKAQIVLKGHGSIVRKVVFASLLLAPSLVVGLAPGAAATACGAEKPVRVDVGSADGLRD
jgi:hypothetical protein